eukprot:scaffold124080_cov76-Attheya_sp.AAC.1
MGIAYQLTGVFCAGVVRSRRLVSSEFFLVRAQAACGFFSLMETLWLCSFITCPNVNATATKKILSEEQLQNSMMRKRMRRMLQVTAAHHNGPLVLPV